MKTDETKSAAARRLKVARVSAGYGSAEAFAKVIGENAVTYRAREAGQNGMTPELAAMYASALGVEPQHILYGTGSGASGRAPKLTPDIFPGSPISISADPKDPTRARLKVDVVLPFEVALELVGRINEATKP